MPKPALPIAAVLTRIAVVVFGLAMFFERAVLRADPAHWVNLLAPVFFLAALWAASDAFVRMDRSDAFGPPMVRGLREIGACLMIGAFAAMVVQPSLIALINNGFTDIRAARVDLDVENVTLALVGLVLIVLARQGQRLQAKLDEFV